MTRDSTEAKTSTIEFIDENCRIKRHARRTESGLMGVNQEINVSGVQKGIDVTARFWIFAVVHVRRGGIQYLRGDRPVSVPTPRYALYAPRYSIVEAALDQSHSHSKALASANALADDLPQQAVVICDPPDRLPSSAADVEDLLRRPQRMIQVGRCIEPPPAAVRIKEAIDRSYATARPLSEVAYGLRMAPATMSRCFKKAYGMAPVHYRHHLRIMDAMMRLLDGEPIAEVSQDVGFGDLSRFYRHFRKFTLAPPARYRV